MKQLKYFDKIHTYAEGQMDDGQCEAFEKELTANAELRTEYDAFLASQKALEVLAFGELGKMMGEEKKEAKVIPIWRRAWARAAAVLLLVGVGLVGYANLFYSNQALAEQYYVEPNVSPTRGSNNSGLMDKAALLFEEGKYQETINLLAGLKEDAPEYGFGQFILGHAYLKIGKATSAIDAFNKVSDPQWMDNARWHRALAYLKNNPPSEMETVFLKEIINYDAEGGYGEKAEELLGKLESRWRVFVF